MQNFEVFTQVDRQISNFAYCMKKTFYGKQEGLYVKTRNRFFGLGLAWSGLVGFIFRDMKKFSLAKCLRITHITLSDRCPPFVLTLMGYHPTLLIMGPGKKGSCPYLGIYGRDPAGVPTVFESTLFNQLAYEIWCFYHKNEQFCIKRPDYDPDNKMFDFTM